MVSSPDLWRWVPLYGIVSLPLAGPSSGVDQDQSGANSPQEGETLEGGATADVPAVPGGQARGVAGHVYEDRKRQIQQNLMLLLHAHKCNRQGECRVIYCRVMKTVLVHMTTCPLARDCPVTHCNSSRAILLHYKTCTNRGCIICSIFRRQN